MCRSRPTMKGYYLLHLVCIPICAVSLCSFKGRFVEAAIFMSLTPQHVATLRSLCILLVSLSRTSMCTQREDPERLSLRVPERKGNSQIPTGLSTLGLGHSQERR